MKRSIAYLPKEKQEDLRYLVGLILERIPQTQMIILYGSYATGKYVDFDTRVEFGIRTTYMSDYDILVVTQGAKGKEVGQRLDNIEEIYYKNPEKQTPVQFINEDIKKLNIALSDGRYFYTQLKEEGVILYNTGKFKLVRRRKLRYDEIKQQAEEYFEEKYENAKDFLRSANYDYKDGKYRMCSFHLHQACENLFYAVRLVFTLENSKQHNLSKLLASVKKYSDGFQKIFPRKTDEEKRLFTLLKSAYVEVRYNADFLVTKDDIDYLFPIVNRLFDLVKELCNKRIQEYGKMK
ncbi:MAG: HEPN domain-containing protein [Tannerellaceae bacterium]|nr:HEPN domain-containing protein [Tannerellaceae bacterium]